MRFIKITDKQTAGKLESLGYKYMTELVNDKEVYVFADEGDLMKLLNDRAKYSKKHWYVDNVLRF